MTEVLFHWSRNTPLEKQSWKKRHNGLAVSAEHSVKTLLSTWSRPLALSGLRHVFDIFWFEDDFIKPDLGLHLWLVVTVISVADSFVQTFGRRVLALSFAVMYTTLECSIAGMSERPVPATRDGIDNTPPLFTAQISVG